MMISTLPSAVKRSYKPFQITTQGWWLVLSDIHLPYHEPAAIEAAVAATKECGGVVGVLLNGDVLDSHELSTFDKDPTAPRYREERRVALKFFDWLRHVFPTERIVFKAGNHEERLDRYLMQRAPALFGLEQVQLPSILNLSDYNIEWVSDKRVIRFGKLNVIHGHEYRPNIQVPVNPARGIFIRTKGNTLGGHFHQTSEHHEPTITGKPQGCWSTGCLCQLFPAYSPLNRWNHGGALVHLGKGSQFLVRNFRIINGKIV